MSWPYHFVDLTQEDIIERRILLDRYGIYAQLSAAVPVAVYQLYCLGQWVSLKRKRSGVRYTKVLRAPGSPVRKQTRLSRSNGIARHWRSALWWLEGELYSGWGLKGHWIAGLIWTSWLLFLTVHKTGDDYMHVTKRFGQVAASQFPFHYMLSMKSIYSPLAFLFGTSHEHLNAYHRISGRIIYCFLVLHATLYLNFFAQMGILQTRLTHLVPFVGAFSIILLTLLACTSLASVRRWSYRVFFIFHLTISVSLMLMLFFHAPPLKFYSMEALVLFIVDIILRKLDTVTAASNITSIEHTKLVKLKIPMPSSKIGRYNATPGQHVYLSLPPESVGSKIIYQLLHNPFSVADVSPEGILLVLRTLHGPTTIAIKQLISLPSGNPAINIEGPYGVARQFPNFATEFDRVLLIAGGVGATFILPVYHQITSGVENERSGSRVELVWAMRTLAEASWVANTQYGSIINGDDRVKIYVTGVDSRSSGNCAAEPEPEDWNVELDDMLQKGRKDEIAREHTRPNLRSIVDNTFRRGTEERIAILVCGPVEMARELRENVGRWVAQGRHVWWHNESFGW